MKSIKMKLFDFKNRHNLSLEIIQKMLEEYANSGPDQARSHFMAKYNISEHVFYRARDFGVICRLVDSKTTKRILAKAQFNCHEHGDKSGRSKKHGDKLLQERKDFFNSFTDSDIAQIMYFYATGYQLSFIADLYYTGEGTIKLLLAKGIITHCNDENKILDNIDSRLKQNGSSLTAIFEWWYKKTHK